MNQARIAPAGVEFRPFRPGDGEAFRLLNVAWIERDFGLEEKDHITLGDPEGSILACGGHIFMAVQEGHPIGCCALILLRPGVFEVGKMTIAEGQRGRGLGRALLAYTVEQAKARGAHSLYLETNDRLLDAIHLYEELGFRHLPRKTSEYTRANVFMELVL